MTLAEFLLARIAEDEAMAERRFNEWRSNGGVLDLTLTIGPVRALAECEAKRSIVEYAEGCSEIVALKGDQFAKGMHCASLHHLRRLALPYADHPDYDEAWSERPERVKP